MSITSFKFLCFYALVLIIYYLVPLIFRKKGQWAVLLAASICFYVMSDNPVLIIYPVLSVSVTYVLLLLLEKVGDKAVARRRVILILELAVLLGILIVLKYFKLVTGGKILIPLGLSFYTFIILGYFIEVYNGLVSPNKNLLKTALFGMFFPVMISGPIYRARDMGEQFYEYHPFDYKKVTYGMQRMLWGFFKELVISERLAVIVAAIFGDDTAYPGAYIWVAAVCFALQLYTNFSGCMDIVIGLAETFGLELPENFRTPFFAKNISEYWRRWHITLGTWMKDNLFYPLLRSGFITAIGKKLKDKLGKKKGKQYTTYIAMFILWFSVGMWHGGEAKYVIGSGLLHWTYIVVGELTLPFFTWLFAGKLHINMKGRFADIVRVIRTFFLVCIGDVFFRADSVPHALRMLGEGVSAFNPGIFFDGSMLELGLTVYDWGILAVSLLILLAVSVFQYEKENAMAGPCTKVRDFLADRNIVLRWVMLIGFLFYVILLAEYGPGYSAAEFIYKDF